MVRLFLSVVYTSIHPLDSPRLHSYFETKTTMGQPAGQHQLSMPVWLFRGFGEVDSLTQVTTALVLGHDRGIT